MSFERRKYCDAFAFLSDCEEELLTHEAEHSLLLGLASNLLRGVLEADDETLFGSVWSEGVFKGAYLRSARGRPLVLSLMSEGAARWLGTALEEGFDECLGALPAVEIFAKEHGLRRSRGLRVEMSQGLYRLDAVEGHRLLAGEKMLLASELSTELIREWIEGFLGDCYPGIDSIKERASKVLEMSKKRGGLYVLANSAGEPVSMAARARETQNGATISLVCTLCTDLKNPTSNGVYRKLGYVKITESMHYKLWEKMD